MAKAELVKDIVFSNRLHRFPTEKSYVGDDLDGKQRKWIGLHFLGGVKWTGAMVGIGPLLDMVGLDARTALVAASFVAMPAGIVAVGHYALGIMGYQKGQEHVK